MNIMTDAFVERAAAYYAGKLEAFGPTPRGVDWNSAESQQLRFRQLLRICDGERVLSLNDYGCGYGALVDYLVDVERRQVSYFGYDAAPSMIAAAHARHAARTDCTFSSDRSACRPRDYAVASGVFNVKGDVPVEDWWTYVSGIVDDLASLSTVGFAFNLLTAYSDADKRRDDLFYADPRAVLDLLLQRWPRRVAVLHDYPLYEFTVAVRVKD